MGLKRYYADLQNFDQAPEYLRAISRTGGPMNSKHRQANEKMCRQLTAEVEYLRGIKQRCEEQLEANKNAVEKFDYQHQLLSWMQAKNSVNELEYILTGKGWDDEDVAADVH